MIASETVQAERGVLARPPSDCTLMSIPAMAAGIMTTKFRVNSIARVVLKPGVCSEFMSLINIFVPVTKFSVFKEAMGFKMDTDAQRKYKN